MLDLKNPPIGEIESFYKFVYERRKADNIFRNHFEDVQKSLGNENDKAILETIKEELKRSNSTVYESFNDLDVAYLRAAVSSLEHANNSA